MSDQDLIPADVPDSKELVNKGGRPKGSKNKITILKLVAEEAVRSKNMERMLAVCDSIITSAEEGDRDCRKLVWQAIMSKSGLDSSTPTGQTPEIIIRMPDRPLDIRSPVVIEQVESTNA